MSDVDLEILCHCHLRWDWVWQRPQHVLSRLARRHRITLEEEPVIDDRPPGLDIRRVAGNVTVLTPHRRPDDEVDFGALVDRYVIGRQSARALVRWFYSPMFASRPQRLADPSEVVVYDCMDELSGFAGCPAELPELERRLLARADVVFTGGKAIWEAKRKHRADAHCFPSAVEASHFARAGDPDVAVPADIAGLPRPIAGYYGVIDERIDYRLLESLAGDPRIGAVVMVGPTAKVDAAALPRHPKLHFVGKRSYAELPAYLKGFDAAIMPFAINEATAHISPTKTLEYMAAGKPVVSTPVRDVVRNHGDLVAIAETAERFADEVAAAAAPGGHPARKADAARRRARENSWDALAERMAGLLADALHRRNGCRSNGFAI